MEISKEAIDDFRKLLAEDYPDRVFTDEEVFDVAQRIISAVKIISEMKVKRHEQ